MSGGTEQFPAAIEGAPEGGRRCGRIHDGLGQTALVSHGQAQDLDRFDGPRRGVMGFQTGR